MVTGKTDYQLPPKIDQLAVAVIQQAIQDLGSQDPGIAAGSAAWLLGEGREWAMVFGAVLDLDAMADKIAAGGFVRGVRKTSVETHYGPKNRNTLQPAAG